MCPYCGSERTYLVQGDESVIKEIATPDEEGSAVSAADGCAHESLH